MITVVSVSVLFVVAALSSWLCCRVLVTTLRRAQVLDVPVDRSMHTEPVPRGAGLAIAGVTVTLVTGFAIASSFEAPRVIVFCAFGLALAALGWMDDRKRQSIRLRLGVQLLLCTLFVTALNIGELNGLATGLWIPVVVAMMVWYINLFNFMDGADGFAGVYTITVCLGIAGLAYLKHDQFTLVCATAIAGSAAGYLKLNWLPARIFMGDSGSYFLGFSVAAMITLFDGINPTSALILLSPFVVDATLTLLKRMWSGEAWWQGHRQHAYQRLILAGTSPATVASALGMFNVVVLWPLAILAETSGYAAVICAACYILAGIIWARIQFRGQVT